ncbi:hydroxyacid dehydrogenase [Rhodococcus sp. 06-1460-1B]|nr:hydroxyacid dehydrogenase [Rhodococcus sp. 06-1460-1B]
MQVELPAHRDRLEDLGYTLVVPELRGQQFSASELSSYADDVVGLIAGDDELSRKFFESAKDLQVLIRWGIGMDSVDHQAAEDHGVTVRNTPGVFGDEVADLAICYALMLARSPQLIHDSVVGGDWPKVEGISLANQQIGIVGLGHIGDAVARRAQAFGMEVKGYDPYSTSSYAENIGLEELLSTSRFVVLTCPATPDTIGLINDRTVRLLAPDSYLINVGRGPVVDLVAFEQAMSEGAIAGAALDVYEIEPLPEQSVLRSLPNVILGAHNGSNTRQGVERASARAVEILLEELAKK